LRIYRHDIYPRDEIDFEVDALNYLNNNGFSVAYPIARKSGGYVTEIMAGAMDIGFCHGDLHGFNAHLDGDVITHYDFEECGFGYRIYDLATFRWSFYFNDSGVDQWTAFLDGYQTIRKTAETDILLLDTFVLIRHIWLIAFHMRNAEDFGYDLASDGYIDYQWKKLRKIASNIKISESLFRS